MNSKFKIKLLSLVLVAVTFLSFSACGKDSGNMEDGGSAESKADVSTGTQSKAPDDVSEKEDLASKYYNWIQYEAFSSESGFVDAMNSIVFPAGLEEYFSSWGEKREKHYIDIFRPSEIVISLQAVYQYEKRRDIPSSVLQINENSKGIYSLKMKIVEKESMYELMLSESKQEMKLVKYDEEGIPVSFHEIAKIDDEHVAVNRGDKSSGTWTSLQLLFKKGGGSCSMTSGSEIEPISIYGKDIPADFAGK